MTARILTESEARQEHLYSAILIRQLSEDHPSIPTAVFSRHSRTQTAEDLANASKYARQFGEKFIDFKSARWYTVVVPYDADTLDLSAVYEETVISHFGERSLWK